MFPGYITLYSDNQNFAHLYFFPGIDNDGKAFYRDLDLSKCSVTYEMKVNQDNSKEYIFRGSKISKVVCKLIDNTNKVHIKELTL